MTEYTIEIKDGIRSGFVWYVSDEFRCFCDGSAGTNAEAQEQAQIAIAELKELDTEIEAQELAGIDPYGLSNDMGMGFSAQSKKEWDERVSNTPLTRYVEDEFGEIVQETEIIEGADNSLIPRPDPSDVDSGLIPRPDPQDVDNGLIPRVNIKKQIMRVQVGGSQVYQLAEIVDDVCVDTWLWSSYELRGFWLDGDIMGWTVSQLRDYGFVFDNR